MLAVCPEPEGGRTLEELYLAPLRKRVRREGGRVFRGGPVFTLLVDIKTDGPATYAALNEVLRRYDDILTRFGAAGKDVPSIGGAPADQGPLGPGPHIHAGSR